MLRRSSRKIRQTRAFSSPWAPPAHSDPLAPLSPSPPADFSSVEDPAPAPPEIHPEFRKFLEGASEEEAVAPPPTEMPDSVREVFGTAELLEGILKAVHPLDLFKLQEVNKEFNNNIIGSETLQKLRLDAALAPLDEDRRTGFLLKPLSSRLDDTCWSPFFSQRMRHGHFGIGPFHFFSLANGGGTQVNGEKQVPELTFSLDLRSIKVKESGWPMLPQEAHTVLSHERNRKLPSRMPWLGYNGKRRFHYPSQSWSRLNMTTDRKPFDIVVWVIVKSGDFYKHVVHCGPGKTTLRSFFDVLAELSDRSMEGHENEAQLATSQGRC